VWFVIQNCNLYGATDFPTEPHGVGISLKNVQNGTLVNNNCYSNNLGIFLYNYACNNTITNNNCSDSIYHGIMLYFSTNNNTLTNNDLYHNANYGIYILSSSTENTIYHNNFYQNNGAGKGVNGNCQAYDGVGGNYWYDNTAQEGNYWSNWDGNGNGTASAYPIAGGAGAYDKYPLSNPAPELSPFAVIALAIALLGIAPMRRRK
jgi:parallel beta-helix repeat protein